MRSRALAVSLVLLLIAVATLPGISFSLSSSVTSYNNYITIENNNPIGLYKTESCDVNDRWTGPDAFSAAIVHIVESQQDGDTIYTPRGDYKEMTSGQGVFLKIDGTGESDLTIRMTYSSDNGNNTLISKVMIELTGGSDSKTISPISADWNTISGQGVTLSGIPCNTAYSLSIEIACSNTPLKDVTTTSEGPVVDGMKVDISFETDEHVLPFRGITINFGNETSSYNGVSLDKSDTTHIIVESTNQKWENKDAIMITTGGTYDSFVGDNSGTSSTTISSDGKHPFKLYLYVGENNNGGFRITVTVNGVSSSYPVKDSKYMENSCYFGSEMVPGNNLQDVTPFDGKITITIQGKQAGNQDKGAVVKLFVVFDDTVPNKVSSANSTGSLYLITNREEENPKGNDNE